MKKYMAILLSILLLMCSVPTVGADTVASDMPSFVVSCEEAKVGETVNVTISAIHNPGIVSARLFVYFDTAVLQFKEAQDGEFGDGYSYTEQDVANEKGFVVVNWCNSIEPDNTSSLLATLAFEVLNDAAYGPSALNIEFSCEDDVFNYDWETVEFTPVHGEVYVLYPVTGVTLDKTTLHMYSGDTATLNATVLAGGKTDETLHWASDNPSVLLVDESGALTAVGLGTATVTVTADGGYTASCEVTVTCGHRQTSAVDAVPSTCVQPGHAAYVLCLDCGEIISGSDADLPLAGHQYDSVVTAPDCENGGYTTHTCTACGDVIVDNRTDAIGHNYVPLSAEPPTCEVDGFERFYCTHCNDSYTNTIPATGHAYDAVVTAPTCGADGYTTHTCRDCGSSYVDSYVSATGDHTYDGNKDNECNDCGYVRVLLGDADGNGKLNNRDLIAFQKYLNNPNAEVTINLAAMDMDGNGKWNNRDLIAFQKILNNN